MLKDTHNRIHDYLRISLTDNCNFRCTYCMPEEDVRLMPGEHLMTREEIAGIAAAFVGMGVNKIRLTGGEPTVRKDFIEIVRDLSHLPVKLSLTTNGVLIDRYIDELIKAGVRSVNISIDSLDPEKFRQITQRDMFRRVWNNIELCVRLGVGLKLNVVLIKGFNDNEVFDFVELTRSLPLHVRFIEFMPFEKNAWQSFKVISNQQILNSLRDQYSLMKLQDAQHDTDKKFRVAGYRGTVSFISTLSDTFCPTCNRLRLTADGKLKTCLFGNEETDLLGAFRRGEELEHLVRQSLAKKHKMLGGQFLDYTSLDAESLQNRSMIKIGG